MTDLFFPCDLFSVFFLKGKHPFVMADGHLGHGFDIFRVDLIFNAPYPPLCLVSPVRLYTLSCRGVLIGSSIGVCLRHHCLLHSLLAVWVCRTIYTLIPSFLLTPCIRLFSRWF